MARGFEEDGVTQKDSPTVSKSVLRIFLAMAASRGWTVKTTDIKSAFLQGKSLNHDVFLQPPQEAEVPDGRIWKLKRCLYGLNDAARQFYKTVVEALAKFQCEQSKQDPALFLCKRGGKTVGVMASHFDDFLHAGELEFDSAVMEPLRERFLAGKLEEGSFSYVGFHISQTGEGLTFDQTRYLEEIEPVEVDNQRALQKNEPLTPMEQTHLRAMVGRINWVVQGSPLMLLSK